MYCLDQPSVSSTTFFSMPTIDHLVYPQAQFAQPPPIMQQANVSPSAYQTQPLILDYANCLSPMVYYEEEEIDDLGQPNGQLHSPHSSVFSPNSTSSSMASSYSESPTIKAQDLLSMSDAELEKLSIRQLNSVLAFGELDHKAIQTIKQRRRTLKNRGYALNCRNRRIKNQHKLEAENTSLKKRCQKLNSIVHELRQKLSFYEPQCLYQQFGEEDPNFESRSIGCVKVEQPVNGNTNQTP